MMKIRIIRNVFVGRTYLREGQILRAHRYGNTNNCKTHVNNEGIILFADEGIFEVID